MTLNIRLVILLPLNVCQKMYMYCKRLCNHALKFILPFCQNILLYLKVERYICIRKKQVLAKSIR